MFKFLGSCFFQVLEEWQGVKRDYAAEKDLVYQMRFPYEDAYSHTTLHVSEYLPICGPMRRPLLIVDRMNAPLPSIATPIGAMIHQGLGVIPRSKQKLRRCPVSYTHLTLPTKRIV